MNQNDLDYMKELLETRKVVPVIDRRYPLGETAQAIRYLIEGHAPRKNNHHYGSELKVIGCIYQAIVGALV